MTEQEQLTAGCIDAILRGEKVNRPVVKILSYELNSSAHAFQDIFKMTIWDSTREFKWAALSPLLNNLIRTGKLQKNSVIRLDQYVCKDLPGSGPKYKAIIILKLSLLKEGQVVVMGLPRSRVEVDPVRVAFVNKGCDEQEVEALKKQNPIPIKELNPYQEEWCIKGRIIHKGCIKRSNFFTMDLADASGVIRVTALNQACIKFYDMMKFNAVFLISRCKIRPYTKQCTTITHDFELILQENSVVACCDEDDCSIPEIYFNFTPLRALNDIPVGNPADLMGILYATSDIPYSKDSPLKLKGRVITLVDTSGAFFGVLLLDTLAENFNPINNPVVAIRKARIEKFDEKKLAVVGQQSHLHIDLDIPQAHRLREWHRSLDPNHTFPTVTLAQITPTL